MVTFSGKTLLTWIMLWLIQNSLSSVRNPNCLKYWQSLNGVFITYLRFLLKYNSLKQCGLRLYQCKHLNSNITNSLQSLSNQRLHHFNNGIAKNMAVLYSQISKATDTTSPLRGKCVTFLLICFYFNFSSYLTPDLTVILNLSCE